MSRSALYIIILYINYNYINIYKYNIINQGPAHDEECRILLQHYILLKI